MNSAVIAILAFAWLVVAYLTYGRHLRRRLFLPEDRTPTPAHALRDDVDYRPAHPFVLFGHHFSSIAGAGPIVGPILAVAFFGWGVPLLWILLGVVLLGGVHDYTALMASVRNQGHSIPDLAGKTLGRRARLLFQVFVLLTLVLVVAAFIDGATRPFLDKPEIVLPSLGLIPWAVVFGLLVYRWRWPLVPSTVLALAGLGLLIYCGSHLPIALHEVPADRFPDAWAVWSLHLSPDQARIAWYLVLGGYGVLASALPVWLLLQPRDYIANWILIVGMALGFVGVLASHRAIQADFFTAPVTAQGPVWPMLFILIACGAISGFHSIVASGTTAKQLAREGHGLWIGYGAMLTEGALAVLALLTVAAGLPWDTLQQMVVQPRGAGAIVAFGEGFGSLTAPLIGATAGIFFGITMINSFVMTTLDTTVRLSRFLVAELAGDAVPWLRNRWVGSLLPMIPALWLVMTGGQNVLWPLFAASNQLVAALALLVLSAWLVGLGKPAWYTLGPALVMLATTLTALAWQARRFLFAYDPTRGPDLLLGSLALLLAVLALLVVGDAVRVARGSRGTRPSP